MPIQAPQWTDYLNCPVCCREFGAPPRSPISLGCGHTLCRHCLKHLHRKQCPFDQTVIQLDPEELVVNTALLQLAGYSPPAQPYHPPSIQALPEHDRQPYDCIVKCLEHLALYLKYCGNVNNTMAGSRLSRPMQRKLVMLLQCAITDEDGRGRAARAARSLGERTVTELILQHQNPQQLSANLWAAVRARGCQFLGPAMQEEVLKLVLLALEDGSALSRKVLVMFVVQRLEPHFPQASKTSIGHVVQLLYRASCFKVSKRECDSSLMQLKEEFRTYESLRREHDAQIVQIATEAGLRIAPDQWSCLLYGDTGHKSHMQSIIDKLQTPQSFAQSVQELFIALQRTGDPAQLIVISRHLDRLANIDASPDARSPSWQQLAEIMTSLKEVVAGLINYLQRQATGRDTNHNQKLTVPDRCIDTSTSQPSSQTSSTPTHAKYKVLMCRDAATRSFCPRGSSCTFAHSEEELERFRVNSNGNYPYPMAGGLPQIPQFPYIPQQQIDAHSYNVPPLPPPMPPGDSSHSNGHQAAGYPIPHPMLIGQPIPIVGEILISPTERYYQYSPREDRPVFRPEICAPYVNNNIQINYQGQAVQENREDIYTPAAAVGMQSEAAEYRVTQSYPAHVRLDPPRNDTVWAPNAGEMYNFDVLNTIPAPPAEMYNFGELLNTLPASHSDPGRSTILPLPRSRRSSPVEATRPVLGPLVPSPTPTTGPTETTSSPGVPVNRRAPGADRARDRSTVTERLTAANMAYQMTGSDDQELEAGLQALERRIVTEFKNAD